MPGHVPRLVWVGAGERALPGILIAWRQVRRTSTGQPVWEGWVIKAQAGAPAHGESIYVYQSWEDARNITPIESAPPKSDTSGYRPVNSDRPQ